MAMLPALELEQIIKELIGAQQEPYQETIAMWVNLQFQELL